MISAIEMADDGRHLEKGKAYVDAIAFYNAIENKTAENISFSSCRRLNSIQIAFPAVNDQELAFAEFFVRWGLRGQRWRVSELFDV